jgi:hypothetical protein
MTVTSASRFSLRIPESWFEFDVWRATRTGDLTRMVDARLAEVPEWRGHRAAILRGLRQIAEEADRRGAVYCAAAADRVDDDGTMLATLMVFTTEGMPDPGLNTVEAIAAQITATARTDDGTDWREVRVVDLPAGRAVRVRGVTGLGEAADVEHLRLVTMQTLIPVPGGDGVLDVVLTSPQVELTDGLLNLFDAISATLTWDGGPAPR